MYVSGNGTVVSDHGHSLYLLFESVIILDQVMRKGPFHLIYTPPMYEVNQI
jgi:hypothetical protein